MSKVKAIFKRNDGKEEVIKVCKTRDEAIDACINYTSNYCLDTKEDRINALKVRDFYVLGCGPEQFILEQVEE